MSTVSSSLWINESLWACFLFNQFLYPILPDLLDCNPFRESSDFRASGDGARVLGSSGLQVPEEIQQVVEVLDKTWTLMSDCLVHPEISSQLIGYLFYFINASLFNSFMERGTSMYEYTHSCHQGSISGVQESETDIGGGALSFPLHKPT